MAKSPYLTNCVKCAQCTSKHYARQHDGQCKSCVSGTTNEYYLPKCPDCGGPISKWKLSQGYHCDACTRETDPIGYANEVKGLYEY